jgi:hypothetical protein
MPITDEKLREVLADANVVLVNPDREFAKVNARDTPLPFNTLRAIHAAFESTGDIDVFHNTLKPHGFRKAHHDGNEALFVRRQVSLCIPTKDRWNPFLKINLPKYLENPYIYEIVICDENGNDKAQIEANIPSSRIKIFKNDTCLGPFFNKRKVVSLATLPTVCLMDSDNFAEIDYFNVWSVYLGDADPSPDTLYSPSFTKPQRNHGGFNFEYLSGTVIALDNYKSVFKRTDIIFNLGNYIVPKDLFARAEPTADDIREMPLPIDVICQNYIIIARNNGKIAVVPHMSYNHIVHGGSFYINSCAGAGVSHERINRFYR